MSVSFFRLLTRHSEPNQSLYNPPQMISQDIGFVMILMALFGIFKPDFLGLSLGLMHCLVLTGMGIVAIWSGLIDDRRKAYLVSLGLGSFFLVNAVAGFLLGDPNPSNELWFKFAPGFLELTAIDHMLHGVLALAFFSEGILWKVSQRRHAKA